MEESPAGFPSLTLTLATYYRRRVRGRVERGGAILSTVWDLPSRLRKPGFASRFSLMRVLAIAVVPISFTAGCMTTRFSLKEISQPVMLNEHVVAVGGEPLPARYVGQYIGEASEVATYGNYSTQTWTNTSQLNASRDLGGRTDRAITGLSLDVSDYMVLFLMYHAGMEARGSLSELIAPDHTP